MAPRARGSSAPSKDSCSDPAFERGCDEEFGDDGCGDEVAVEVREVARRAVGGGWRSVVRLAGSAGTDREHDLSDGVRENAVRLPAARDLASDGGVPGRHLHAAGSDLPDGDVESRGEG